MDRRAFLAAAATGAGAGVAGCTSVFGSDPPEYDVGMRASAFVPATIEVGVDETLVWYNNNDRPHTVTAYEDAIPEEATYFASGGFESTEAARDGWDNLEGSIDPGGRYEHTFETVGTYRYFCIPHEKRGMVGTVTVSEGTETGMEPDAPETGGKNES